MRAAELLMLNTAFEKHFVSVRSTQIELLLDDFVLPPFERSEIIQENDLIR